MVGIQPWNMWIAGEISFQIKVTCPLLPNQTLMTYPVYSIDRADNHMYPVLGISC